MKKTPISLFAKWCGGELKGKDCEITGVARDNREIEKGQLFVALCGEKFDGHNFVKAAEEAGAAAALVSHEISGVGIPQIVTEDTGKALLRAAKEYLASLKIHRIGITGSVGKTTTKEMTAAVLSASYKTHKTKGNYNNAIGLPLTVFDINEDIEAAVLEMGTNHFGEIRPLAETANPEVAVITAIGACHLEAFKTKEGVLREKSEILRGLCKDGTAVLNGDDPLLWGMRESIDKKVLWFGIENRECDVLGEIISNESDSSSFKIRGSDVLFSLPCGGEHNIRDALCAIAVGKVFGVSESCAADALLNFKNTGMRQNISELRGATVIRDCYNANPESLRAALEVLKKTGNKKRIAVLGDMYELGENAKIFHRECGEYAARCADVVLTCGEYAKDYAAGAKDKAQIFCDKKSLAKALEKMLEPGDAVLVKGSNGAKMWEVIDRLTEGCN